MSFKQNFALQGKFSFKIYDQSGNLKQEVKDIPNFITSTGLSYPAIYNFADCFRFISLGSGTTQNTILGTNGGTTGLSQPLNNFSYIGSRTSYNDSSTSQYELGSCGYRESLGQVVLSRGWRLPIGSGTFSGNYTFNELMLTPGRPTGIAKLCGCAGGDISNGGVDASAIADYYDTLSGPKSICNATKAFTRIVPDIPISVTQNDFVIINYDLTINYDTGINPFNIHITNSFSPYWSGNITGSYNLIHHGIKIINDSDYIDKSNFRNQISPYGNNYSWTNEKGESFTPLWGSPLEPSCLASNLLAYFSTDNVNFLFNQFSGGHLNTGYWKPFNLTGFNISNGLMAPVPYPTNTNSDQLFNIRTDNSSLKYPNQSDIKTDGLPYGDINYIFHSFSNKSTAMLPFLASGRSRSMLYPFVFTNLNSSNWIKGISPIPLVRSMILNYSDDIAKSNSKTYPFLDLLFTGTNGEGLVSTGEWYYNNPSTNYYPLGNGGDLTISFLLTWSSPCNGNVIGC